MNPNVKGSRGVIYLLTGASHAVRLVTSLWSLRRHYDGDITVFTTRPESHRIGEFCAGDPRLKVSHCQLPQEKLRKNASYVAKTVAMRSAPYEINLFLDADTLIVGNLDELFDVSSQDECIATQFSNWTTGRRVIQKRLNSWRDLDSDRFNATWINETVDRALQPQPAINTGVLAFRHDASILEPWQALTQLGRRKFICDEVAFQLLLTRHPHRIGDCRFNCSPVHGADSEDVRIWHFHGDKHIRRESGRRIWLPEYSDCVANNVAGLAEWSPDADTHLRDYLATSATDSSIEVSNQFQSARTPASTTIVTSVNRKTVKHLRVTLPAWKRKPDIAGLPLIVFCDDVASQKLTFIDQEWDGPVQLRTTTGTPSPDASHDEATTFLIDAPAAVETEYWIRIDPSVLFLNDTPLFPNVAPQVDTFGHRWGYSKPASWLLELDKWFSKTSFRTDFTGMGEEFAFKEEAEKFRHKRLTSWVSMHQTEFTRRVAASLDDGLPIPSHDTILWRGMDREFKITSNAFRSQKP